ncbi:hypothetical protein [Roseivivax sediminis]|uniref:Ig-like domain-containing protein n=1 Tax=Roseivivax sediminis TaxID=936889 RepID=A0A1I1SM77_9RHOB|nr:hypothetical protein [Roseivivax sediminis]SFD47579.1 hypothetical protein SAMN04515678_101236 [Roseivivax sediminis]
MKSAPLLVLPAALLLAACDTGMGPGADGPAPTQGYGWTVQSDPVSAAFGPVGGRAEVSVACRATPAGARVVAWTYDAPARPGTGEVLTIAAGGLQATVSMTGQADDDGSGGLWVGSVAPNDPSRQVLAAASDPVTFSLSSGASVTAPEAGPALQVYRACW